MSKKSKSQVQSTEEVAQVETVIVEPVLKVVEQAQAQAAEIVKEVTKARGIGKFITEQILTTNKSNTEILEEVLKTFEGSKTTMACIAWYKSKLRKEGKIGPRTVAKVEEVKGEEVQA